LINPENYAKLWFLTQEDQDSYDSLMRKKIYFQNSFGKQGENDFIVNGFKTTFGIFTKEFKERRFEKSDLLKKQEKYITDLANSDGFKEKALSRYHSYTSYDYDGSHRMNHLKGFLLILMLRELPLKHFYARAFVIGFVYVFWWAKHWHYNTKISRKATYYPNKMIKNDFENFPMLKQIVTERTTSKLINPAASEADVWWYYQQPVFYHHHHKHYRYIFRDKRVIPWDGTFNMPIYPFLHMKGRTEFVHNGLNEACQPNSTGTF